MKGRIERPEATKPRLVLPRVGKIRIGVKNAKGYPQSLDYFIATGKYAGLFLQAYGEKPQIIQIVFPDDDPEKVCCERYEYRDDEGNLVAYGDGCNFDVWNPKTKRYESFSAKDYPQIMQSIQNRYPTKLSQKTGDGWRVRLTLNFIIPLVRGVAGIWTFETNGNASTIPQIRETFDCMLLERGFCKGIIFDLSVQFAVSQKPGVNSRYPVVSLIPNESADNVLKVKKAYEPIMEVKK